MISALSGCQPKQLLHCLCSLKSTTFALFKYSESFDQVYHYICSDCDLPTKLQEVTISSTLTSTECIPAEAKTLLAGCCDSDVVWAVDLREGKDQHTELGCEEYNQKGQTVGMSMTNTSCLWW